MAQVTGEIAELSAVLRRQYLQTLGIVQYVSRDLQLVAEGESSIAIAQQTAPTGSPSERINLDQNTVVTAKAKSATKVRADTVESATAVGEISENIAVKFALWQPTAELLVCSSVEGSLPGPEQIQLLGNILLAMGQGNGHLPQMDIAQWPPYANARADEAEVREFLLTLIQARVDSKSAKMLLLLGDAAADWLLSAAQKAALANGQVDIFPQVTALLLPSLQEMIEQPQRKRDAWQTVRFLSPLRTVNKAAATGETANKIPPVC